MAKTTQLGDKLLQVSNWLDTDAGLLVLIAFLRACALLGLAIYFILSLQYEYLHDTQTTILAALLAFTIYVLAYAIGAISYPNSLLGPAMRPTLIVADISFYTLFYYLSEAPGSDIYFLYLMPLFASFRYLSIRLAFCVLCAVSLSFTAVLYLLAIATNLNYFAFLQILLWRHFLLVVLTLFHSFRRKLSVLDDMRRGKSQLSDAFNAASYGVFVVDRWQQLLFVNDYLRNRHGDFQRGQRCADYFRCSNHESCSWCATPKSQSQPDPLATNNNPRQRRLYDHQGRAYHAEASSFPLLDAADGTSGAVALVMDVSKQTENQRRLEDKVARATIHVRNLTLERTRWLDTYNDLGKRLAGMTNLEALLQYVVQEARSRLMVEVATLFLFDERKGCLVRRATTGIEPEWLPDETYCVGEGIVGKTILPKGDQKYGQSIRTLEADKDPNVAPFYVQQYQQKLKSGQVKHLITTPLNGLEKSFGVLRVINKLDPNGALAATGFPPEDVDFLVTIASMVAIAVENAKFVDEIKRHMNEIQAVHDASQVVASSLQIETVLQKIVTLAGNVSDSDHTGVLLIGHEGELLTSVEDHPLGMPLHRRARPGGVTTQVIQQKKPLFVDDTELNPAAHNPLILAQGFRSYAGIPIIARDHVLGVLFVHNRRPHAFQAKADVLNIFCNHVATALENARLLQKLDEEARLKERQRLSEDLHDTMNVLHGTLVLGTAYQKELLNSHAYEQAAANLDKLNRAAIHTYRNLRRLLVDVRDPILQDYGLRAALQNYVEMLSTTAVEIEINGEILLPKDTEYAIYKIAQEALSNATKHGTMNGQLQVVVQLTEAEKRFCLKVCDNGIGFDVQAMQQQDAFGLQSMKRWAHSIQAELLVDSQPGNGTTVSVQGPL